MGFSNDISHKLKHKIRRRKHDVKDLSKVTGGVMLVTIGVFCGALLFADDSPMMEQFLNVIYATTQTNGSLRSIYIDEKNMAFL